MILQDQQKGTKEWKKKTHVTQFSAYRCLWNLEEKIIFHQRLKVVLIQRAIFPRFQQLHLSFATLKPYNAPLKAAWCTGIWATETSPIQKPGFHGKSKTFGRKQKRLQKKRSMAFVDLQKALTLQSPTKARSQITPNTFKVWSGVWTFHLSNIWKGLHQATCWCSPSAYFDLHLYSASGLSSQKIHVSLESACIQIPCQMSAMPFIT